MRKLTFLACLLIATSCYSQTTYPKQIVLDGDSLVLIDHNQLTLLNYTFLSLEECKALNISYLQQIELYKTKLLLKDKLEANLRTQMGNDVRIIRTQEESIETLEKSLENANTKLKFAKTTRIIYTCVGVVGGAYLGYTGSKFVSLILP